MQPGPSDRNAELRRRTRLRPERGRGRGRRSERTKATRYATHTFLTVYATALGPQVANDLESRLLTARVSIFVLHGAEGSGVVTVRHETDAQHPVFDIDEVVRRWDDNSDLLRLGSPALLHGLLDVVVDAQFDTIQQLDDAIEVTRRRAVRRPRADPQDPARHLPAAKGTRRTAAHRAADA